MKVFENKMAGKILFMVGLFFMYLWNISAVGASEKGVPESGIQISPSKVILNSEPGEVKEVIINVKNYDKKIVHNVSVSVEDFYVINESSKAQFFIPDEKHKLVAYDVIEWIDVEKGFILEPNEAKDVKVKMNVPTGTATGGYYGVIFFKTSERQEAEASEEPGAAIDVNYRVGTLLINAVHGDEPVKIEGRVEDFRSAKKIFWSSPIELFADLYSSGNIHYRADGKMKVEKFGKKFATLDVGSEVMYPNRSRRFKETIEMGLFDFGIYTAVLDMESEDDTVKFKSSSKSFYVIPWKGLLIIFGGLTVLGILKRSIKKYVHIGRK